MGKEGKKNLAIWEPCLDCLANKIQKHKPSSFYAFISKSSWYRSADHEGCLRARSMVNFHDVGLMERDWIFKHNLDIPCACLPG